MRQSALADEYDEMQRGPRQDISPEAHAEAVRAFDDPVGQKAYREIAGTILGTGASMLIPQPFTAGGLAGRMAAGGIMGAGSTAAYEATHSALTGAEPSLTNVGIGAGLGAILPWGAAKAVGALKASASVLYRGLGNFAERMKAVPPSTRDLAAQLPDVEEQMRARAIKARGEAARLAYREIIPENTPLETVTDIIRNRALASARRAAAEAGHGPGPLTIEEDPTLAAQFANDLTSRLSNIPRVGGAAAQILGEVRTIWGDYVTRLGTWMRTDRAVWGEAGPKGAGLMERTQILGDMREGRTTEWIEKHIFDRLKNRAERMNLNDVLRKNAKPANERVAEAAQAWRTIAKHGFDDATQQNMRQYVPPDHSMGQSEMFPELADLARAMDQPEGDWIAVPLQHRANYAPTYRDEGGLVALLRHGSPERAKAIQQLVRTRGLGAGEAAKILDELAAPVHGGQEFDHSFQYARNDILDELGVPFEQDPDIWMRRWAHSSSRRLARAAVWGPSDEGAKAFRQELVEGGGDKARWDKTWRVFIGHPLKEDIGPAGLARVVGTAQTIVGLGPRVGILQNLQLANPIGKFGLRPTLAALHAAASDPELVKMVDWTGATLPSMNMSWVGGAERGLEDIGKLGSAWVKHITQMPRQDRFVRIVSSVASGIQVQAWADDLMRTTGTGYRGGIAARQLTSLGLDPKLVLRQGGKLTPEQIEVAMLSGANVTQFASHMTDMPAAWRTQPIGRWIYKFRTFAKQQSNFITSQLLPEARRGNLAPAARYLASYATLYNAAAPVMDYIAGVDRKAMQEEYDGALDHLEAYLYAGMLGGFGDAITVARHSTAGRVAGFLFGPAVGNALQGAEAVQQSAKNEDFSLSGPLGLWAVRQIPLVGGHAKRYVEENF